MLNQVQHDRIMFRLRRTKMKDAEMNSV